MGRNLRPERQGGRSEIRTERRSYLQIRNTHTERTSWQTLVVAEVWFGWIKLPLHIAEQSLYFTNLIAEQPIHETWV